ncbi:MAG: homocysteine S-methyltransferase family protein [Ilumatobacteraceae bacterium]
MVRDVHAAYIDAGAELIIANTYATSPLLFDRLGRGDDVERIDRIAVGLAQQAGAGRVAIGGSISVMRPVVGAWPERRARDLYRRKADSMAATGVDVLVMEMMRDTDYSRWATEAAVATGLPVWVGISVERSETAGLVGASRPDCPLEGVIDALAELDPDLIAIMHSSVTDTGPALEVVRARSAARLGTYPEYGTFEMPDWRFVDVGVDDLVANTRGWIDQGARVVGGCCGISPEHIAGLAAAFAR